MIIIADSGSTKTDWYGMDKDSQQTICFQTAGINPCLQDGSSIVADLEKTVLPLLYNVEITSVWFYGAGCTDAKKTLLSQCIRRIFPHAAVHVHSDLLGAARALCGRQEGIACILGTGSNSCYYDGCCIKANTSPLGFILGDEGSGAVLGKKIIGEVLKGSVSDTLYKAFFEETGFTTAEIIRRVYREAFPNRFLASLAPFIARHRAELQMFLVENFREFFKKNLWYYPKAHVLPVHFTGSIAFHFQSELKMAAEAEGYCMGTVLQKPIKKLMDYHLMFPDESE